MDIPYKPAKPGKDRDVIPKQPWGPPQQPQMGMPMNPFQQQPQFVGEWGNDPWDLRERGDFPMPLSQILDLDPEGE